MGAIDGVSVPDLEGVLVLATAGVVDGVPLCSIVLLDKVDAIDGVLLWVLGSIAVLLKVGIDGVPVSVSGVRVNTTRVLEAVNIPVFLGVIVNVDVVGVLDGTVDLAKLAASNEATNDVQLPV